MSLRIYENPNFLLHMINLLQTVKLYVSKIQRYIFEELCIFTAMFIKIHGRGKLLPIKVIVQ